VRAEQLAAAGKMDGEDPSAEPFMSYADAFLRAVLADPEDDAPRLIYADWLDEQGDGDRAEFIRVQCAVARLDPDEGRRADLRRRERDLLRRHEVDWAGWLGGFASGWVFERGFVGSLTVVIEPFLRYAERVFEREPVRHVKLRGTRRRMAALAAESSLERLSSLDLSHDRIESAGAVVFFRSPHLGGLKDLNLCWNRLGVEGVRALAECSSLGGLRRLNLERAVPAAALSALAASAICAGLTELNLQRNGLGTAEARLLAASPYLDRLCVLDLGDNALDGRAREELRERFGVETCRF
jgi:uncharacterized protein (TIGR02996 family)